MAGCQEQDSLEEVHIAKENVSVNST